jgi:dihydrofolate reductase
MREVILQEFVTLDGLAAGPNNSVDFVPASTSGDQKFSREQLAFFDAIDTIVLGRVTYQLFAGYWPKVTEGDEKPFADKMNSTPKIVFSRTLDRAPWGTFDEATVLRSDPAAEVSKLKQQPGRNLVIWGSLSLAQLLIGEGLIDEYRLVVCPLVLGQGRHLFNDALGPIEVTLLNASPLDRGAVSLTYKPSRRSNRSST